MKHALLVGLGLAALASPALADGGVDALFQGHCYARTYDARHLARNPRQRVTYLAVGRSGEEAAPESMRNDVSILSLRTRVRGSRDTYEAGAECRMRGAAATCRVEADGGAFDLEPGPRGTLRLVVVGRLAMEGSRGFSPELGGPDDRVFSLSSARGAVCPGP